MAQGERKLLAIRNENSLRNFLGGKEDVFWVGMRGMVSEIVWVLWGLSG